MSIQIQIASRIQSQWWHYFSGLIRSGLSFSIVHVNAWLQDSICSVWIESISLIGVQRMAGWLLWFWIWNFAMLPRRLIGSEPIGACVSYAISALSSSNCLIDLLRVSGECLFSHTAGKVPAISCWQIFSEKLWIRVLSLAAMLSEPSLVPAGLIKGPLFINKR